MNKLYTTLLIACIAVGFTACNDDDCDDLHLAIWQTIQTY